MKTATIKIEGIAPLIMHADNIEWADMMKEWQKSPDNRGQSQAGDDRTPPWRWKGALWNDGERVAIPCEALMTCIREAATKVGTGKGKATWKKASQSALIPGATHFAVEIHGQQISMTDINNHAEDATIEDHRRLAKSLGFALDTRRARVSTSKHIRVRPIFYEWGATAVFTVTNPDIVDVLPTIMDTAGSQVGLGDWRPSSPYSPGPFGLFRAKTEIK